MKQQGTKVKGLFLTRPFIVALVFTLGFSVSSTTIRSVVNL